MKELLLILLIAVPLWALEYTISPSGNDDWPGTTAQPFRTLEHARDAIRHIKATDGLPSNGVTVWLRQGVYELNQSFELSELDSGTPEQRISYSAYPGEKVTLTGSRLLPPSSFAPVSKGHLLQRLPVKSRDQVRVCDLDALGIKDYGRLEQYGHALPVVPAPMELFVDRRVMTLARYPNDGYLLIGEVLDPGSIPRYSDYENIRGGTFRYTDDRHKRWLQAKEIWLQGTFMWGYADDHIKVAEIDTLAGTVRLASPHMYGIGTDKPYRHYYARNLLEELDQPGEYYIDRKNGLLYLWPPALKPETEIRVSMVEEPLIVLENVSFVDLKNLTVAMSRGMGIYLEGGENNLIAGCTLHALGTLGILMGQGARQTFPHITHEDYEGVPVSRDIGNLQGHIYKYTTWERNGGHDHRILSCDVFDTGCGGIYLSGGSKKNLILGNCSVENCRIHDYNRRNKFLWSAINVDGCGNRVAHNEIFNSEFQGIYVHGNDHLFEYNHIHHTALNSNDTSPWYMGRDPSDRGTVIRYNFFHHCGSPDREWTMGVYFDDGTCGALVEGNVFYKVGSYGTVYSNAGHDLLVRNNIFVQGYGPVLCLKSMWYDFGYELRSTYFDSGGIYHRRLKQLLDITQPPYSERYPELVDWMDLMSDGKTYVGMHPRRNRFDTNVIIGYGETYRLVGEHAQFDFGKNYQSSKDPGFIDPAALNFQLSDDSPVYRELPDLQKIPFEKIGLYSDVYRTVDPE
ncbi:right-handed parallel beta-helix repeat-containing protein [candidate division KSB1 bacterium]|nr:right-handed parallel beta-helix repeat-containing protein [candidate division KSB1 bacterium]